MRYIPGEGIVRTKMQGQGRRVELPRGIPRARKRPSLRFIQETGELAVRTATPKLYRRRLYKG